MKNIMLLKFEEDKGELWENFYLYIFIFKFLSWQLQKTDAFFVIFDRHCEKFNFQMEPGDEAAFPLNLNILLILPNFLIS